MYWEIFLSILIISLVSFIGLILLSTKNLINRISILMISFAAGAMLADVFIHILPEFIEEYELSIYASISFIVGILLMFIIEKTLHWHHCHNDLDNDNLNATHKHIEPYAIMSLVGDFFHNFLDGVVVASAYMINFNVGLATTIAVVLHEIPQELSDFGILMHSGFTKSKALFYNFLVSLSAFLGAIFTIVLASYINNVIFYLIPLSAGTLIYVAMSDLIPQLHKESDIKISIWQIVFFVLGILIMLAFLLLE